MSSWLYLGTASFASQEAVHCIFRFNNPLLDSPPAMTLFEKIIARQIPAKIVAESEDWLAFHDISPQAPVHVLVVPKKVITRVGEATPEDESLLGKLLLATQEVARALGVSNSGFRIVINHGRDGGETVPHLHIHVLGGRPLGWPPG